MSTSPSEAVPEASNSPSSPPDRLGNFRNAALPVLTKISHGTAPFIATFLLIHLSAPVAANLGGSTLASQVMLLGREYYQTPLGENLLLRAPLLLHAVSSTAKRLLSPPGRRPRPITSLLAVTGYATLFFFLPVHFGTHRAAPSLPAEPIFAVGPSELDYEFVKVGLSTFPWRSWLLYAGLVGGVVLHWAEGASIIFNTWVNGQGKMKKKTTRTVALGTIAMPVMSGLLVLSQEPLMAFTSLVERYKAAFRHSLVYRI